MPVKLRDIIEALVERGEADWAEACAWILPLEPMMDHGFTYDEILDMTIEEIEVWRKTPPKPLKYDGWQFWWGKAAFR